MKVGRTRLIVWLCLATINMWSVAATGAPIKESDTARAESHEHWEHIVRRRSVLSRYDTRTKDDGVSHIVNVQDYYRAILDQDVPDYKDHERELFNLLQKLEAVSMQNDMSDDEKGSLQEQTAKALNLGVHSWPIKGRFIVMFQEDANDFVLDRTIAIMQKANKDSNHRVRMTDVHTLRNVGKGLVATMNYKAVQLMSQHPLVAHIEEDVALRRSEFTYHQLEDAVWREKREDVSTEGAVTWNLDRLDQHNNTLDGSYNPEGTGKNVDIYIIDTGVLATHQELAGRVHYAMFDAVDFLTGSKNHGKDCNGHGTHCAGTAAGTKYGVAKEAEIYNLRALNCKGSGAVSGIVTGIDKIIEHHKAKTNAHPTVVSQSLGVHKSDALNMAIDRAVEAGITMIGAAGNQADDSCKYSPASATKGISVGATDQNDEVTVFTNTGSCTTIMAPGYQIKSASNQCDSCTKTMSGTSMATPHAAGYAAIILGLYPQLNAVELKEKMINQSTKGVIKLTSIAQVRAEHTHSRLLYVPKPNAKDSDLVNLKGKSHSQSRP